MTEKIMLIIVLVAMFALVLFTSVKFAIIEAKIDEVNETLVQIRTTGIIGERVR